MYNKIYERKEFMIFQVREGYIVYNAKKSFQEVHTHLKHFEAAKTAIDLVIRKKIPKSTHGYYLTSLIRLSEDDCYINKIKELMESRFLMKSSQDVLVISQHVMQILLVQKNS